MNELIEKEDGEKEHRIYRPLEKADKKEAEQILSDGIYMELVLLPLRIGEYCDNWKEAQDICLKLMENENAAVRANAALGLSYIARTHEKLEKRVVRPYLLRELKENEEYRWRIIDSIKDINLFMGWNIAEKALKRYSE